MIHLSPISVYSLGLRDVVRRSVAPDRTVTKLNPILGTPRQNGVVDDD